MVVTPKSILIVTCTFLGDPLWHHAICIYNWISSVIFVNSMEIQEITKNIFFCSFSLAKQTIAKMKFKRPNAFSDLKSGFKKKWHIFPFFLHKPFFWSFVQLQKILCSRLLASFSFFGITKAPLSFKSSQSREENLLSELKKKRNFFYDFSDTFVTFGAASMTLCAFTVIAPNTQLFSWLYQMPISSIFT